jgi:hypothetical protein
MGAVRTYSLLAAGEMMCPVEIDVGSKHTWAAGYHHVQDPHPFGL